MGKNLHNKMIELLEKVSNQDKPNLHLSMTELLKKVDKKCKEDRIGSDTFFLLPHYHKIRTTSQ